MFKTICFSLLFLFSSTLLAQSLQTDQQNFAQRRTEFMTQMDSDAVAIFPCKAEYLRNLDNHYPYRQESNFYYLSGFEEPQSVILLIPSATKYKYILYVRKRDRRWETFEGPRAGVEGAISVFEADTALVYDDLKSTLRRFIKYDRTIYYTFGINPELDQFMQHYFIERRSSGNWPIIDPAPILNQMRLIKNQSDWSMGLQKAIDISAQAHLEVMRAIQPGMYEYEIQAVFEYIYRKMGSPRNGYPCIVGSGPNATILHYSLNNRQLRDGEVILMDCAAEYGYYSADITRTVPVNGKFSAEQRNIYEIVLNAQKEAIRLVKPGITLGELTDKIDEVLGEGLLRLGFIKDKNDHGMFSLHGYSHWIGLEVHDVGAYQQKNEYIYLRPGMVFTIEPGLYFRPDVYDKMIEKGYSEKEIEKIKSVLEKYMHMGMRVEDDILVTEKGAENLTKSVPKEISEIEALMAKEPEYVLNNR